MKNASPKKAPGCEFVIDDIKVVQRNTPKGQNQFELNWGLAFTAPDGKGFSPPRPEQMTDEEKAASNKLMLAAFKKCQETTKAAADTYQAALEEALAPFLDRAYSFSSK